MTYNEVVTIIAKAIGKPDLKYMQPPDEQVRPALVQMGCPSNLSDRSSNWQPP